MVASKAVLLLGVSSFVLGFALRSQFGAPERPDCAGHAPVVVVGQPHVEPQTQQKQQTAAAAVGGTWNDENDVVIGLARSESAWKTEFRMFVGTLRHTGYKGRIVLFVHPSLLHEKIAAPLKETKEYLVSRGVELVGVRTTPCEFAFKPENVENYDLRKHCTVEYPLLQLEWARFAMSRDWLMQNPKTGWFLTTDVRDTFFQRPPFADLGPPSGSQVFVYEEYYGDTEKTIERGKMRGIDCTHWFCRLATKCYGDAAWKKYKSKPMLCAGQILGNRAGSIRMLNEFIDEMIANGKKGPSCVPPVLPDQPMMNYLIWSGLMNVTTVPYGDGPVLTIGGACTTNNGKRGLRDLLDFDSNQMIMDKKGRTAAVVHQWDRCGDWMERWLRHHLASFGELKLDKRWEAKESPSVETIAEPPKLKPTPPPAVPKGPRWVECADENSECKCTTEARFGSDDQWTTLNMDGKTSIMCLNSVAGGEFSDPAPGVPKNCECKVG